MEFANTLTLHLQFKKVLNLIGAGTDFFFFLSIFVATNITHRPNFATPQITMPTDIKIGITCAYAVIFVIALVGNTIGLLVVLRKSSRSAIVTNLFIGNMAAADLILTLTPGIAIPSCFFLLRQLVD